MRAAPAVPLRVQISRCSVHMQVSVICKVEIGLELPWSILQQSLFTSARQHVVCAGLLCPLACMQVSVIRNGEIDFKAALETLKGAARYFDSIITCIAVPQQAPT